jgi:ribosome biogenesis protein MAK21
MKVEPKYAHAESSCLWELASLARHCHPTVCLWAETILGGKAIDYAGDPLLDFGLANFLDRVSYKNPKSTEQSEVFRKRMAAYEKPINTIDFHGGEVPEIERGEE